MKIKGKINTFGKKLRESVTSKSLKNKKRKMTLYESILTKELTKSNRKS